MKEERFVNTPAYKTAIGDWEIHCTNKTYRLTALQLLDEHGKEISKHSYTATNIRPMSVMNGTITENNSKPYAAASSNTQLIYILIHKIIKSKGL